MRARVFLEVDAPLLRLVSGLSGVEAVTARGNSLPDDAIDLQCSLMSLPLALGTRLDTIPAATAYLRPDPARVALWRDRLGSAHGPRVGLVWSGSTAHKGEADRSIALARLAPLLDIPAQWHSLQKEHRAHDLHTIAAGATVRRHDASLEDFADTAALIACMDLVISVDTSVAHLAGALGKPVWIMLPHAPDFRWMIGYADSPWYPPARLFRQGTRGDWDGVIADVARAVAARLRSVR